MVLSLQKFYGITLYFFSPLQEPGTNAEIKERILSKYNVTFDLFAHIDVNGPDAHPLFVYLKRVLPGTITEYDMLNISYVLFI